MTCDQIEAGDLAERYVLGELEAGDRDAYEDHYFQCVRCFEELQLRLTMQAELKKVDSAPRAGETRRAGARVWVAWGAAAACLSLAAGLGWWSLRPAGRSAVGARVLEPAQAAIPEALLRIAAPVYTAPALRLGVGGDDRFRTGMEQYREGHYTEAIPELVAATDANAKSADAQFFLGICYLMDGQTSSAVMRLRATIALGESLDLELAHFYLAKALLRANDVPGARNALENTIALHGDLEREAQDMLSQLRELPRPRSK